MGPGEAQSQAKIEKWSIFEGSIFWWFFGWRPFGIFAFFPRFWGPKWYLFHAQGPSLFRTFLLPLCRHLPRGVPRPVLEPKITQNKPKSTKNRWKIDWKSPAQFVAVCSKNAHGLCQKSSFIRSQNTISRGNLAKTLHKILQWTWAIPPAGTNSEGAAVSR